LGQEAPERRTAMSFREWLGQIGLARCGQVLLENGIDFDIAPDLTENDLLSIGLNLGDTKVAEGARQSASQACGLDR
jgi:SAM domain (Sterile alpha motif)